MEARADPQARRRAVLRLRARTSFALVVAAAALGLLVAHVFVGGRLF